MNRINVYWTEVRMESINNETMNAMATQRWMTIKQWMSDEEYDITWKMYNNRRM